MLITIIIVIIVIIITIIIIITKTFTSFREISYVFIIFLDSTKLQIVWIKITIFFKRRVSIILLSFSS